MSEEQLFEIDPRGEVEGQVDAMFDVLYARIETKHHKMIERVERHMINALKAAMRLPATEPVAPDPNHWPWDAGERLAYSLSPDQQRHLREMRKRPKKH